MTVELLQTLSIVAYILMGVFFLLTIALFFWLKVPKLYADLSGLTEKRAIESIRKQNEESADAAGAGNTDKISSSGRLLENTVASAASRKGSKKEQTKAPERPLSSSGNETTVLNATVLPATSVAGTNETTVLDQALVGNETTVLDQNRVANGTWIHRDPIPAAGNALHSAAASSLTVEIDLFFAESKELIQ